MQNPKKMTESLDLASTSTELGCIRRQEFPNIIRDNIQNSDPGVEYIVIMLDHRIALAVAEDLDLAIEKEPNRSYHKV